MIIPFGICVVLLMVIWYQHYLFFLKYGLQDANIVSINTILIFLILVYVYPLKFLARFLFESVAAIATGNFDVFRATFTDFSPDNMAFLMVFYGLGAFSIFAILAWMYHYALKKKDDLHLNAYEQFSTRAARSSNLLMATLPLLSAIIAWLGNNANFWTFTISGFIYFLYTPMMFTFSAIMNKRKAKYLEVPENTAEE